MVHYTGEPLTTMPNLAVVFDSLYDSLELRVGVAQLTLGHVEGDLEGLGGVKGGYFEVGVRHMEIC